MRGVVVALAACIAVAGCATQEFKQARNVCAARYNAEIPANLQQQWVQRNRTIEVPDGNITCSRNYYGGASCTQGTRVELIPYTSLETVDLNKVRRDAEIARCAAAACTEMYGNPKCKTGAEVADQ